MIIYLIFQDSRISHRRYGLCVFRATIPLKALGGVGVILLALLPFYLIIGLLVFTGVIPPWDAADLKFSNYPILPLVFLTCICTGYLEESFFRAYLLTKGEGWGIGRTTLIVLSNTLFALGHLYQGMAGFFLTFLIGLALSWLFLRTRNLHFIAWSHGYYNFLVLLFNSLVASVGGALYAPIP